MQVTCRINDYSHPAQPCIKVHSNWSYGDEVELEIDEQRYVVNGKELISAVERCMLDNQGR